jgi:hypothetical protein
MIPLLLICVRAKAGEPVDLLPTTDRGSSQESDSGTGSKYILDAAWIVADPLGEFDSSLGAAGALNRALSFYFSGHASDRQLKVERDLISEHGRDGVDWAPFAVRVFSEIMVDIDIPLPEPVELKPFDLTPSEPPTVSPDNPHIVSVRYDDEEYLERLLQRLYFKLIQGPVLLTVPYSGGDERVPEEYRNWNNFRYASDDNVMQWDDTRLVWVDWDLTQTVVLRYEDGLIACYDSGRKYYIDHTAAVAAAGAMLAHPDIDRYAPDGCLNFVLTSVDNE